MSTASVCSLDYIPSVSVVVRSCERHACLLEVLALLAEQDHPDFEVVVVEQSHFSAELRAPLDDLAERDPRFRFFFSGRLGVCGARDAGWRHAKNEIVLWVDDDDLPVGRDFITRHAKNYADPTILAVTGRHVYSVDERCGYGSRWRARRYCLSYNFFGYPHVFCRFDERIETVSWMHGTNGSIRRSVIERVGGFPDDLRYFDEHPFFLRLRAMKRPGERLVFDPTVKLIRRKDVGGGAAMRFDGASGIFAMWLDYYHRVFLPIHPLRSALMYPIFPLAAAFSALRWIWVDSMVHRTLVSRAKHTLEALVLTPLWYVRELAAQYRRSAARRSALSR